MTLESQQLVLLDQMTREEQNRYWWHPSEELLSAIDVINIPNQLEEMYQGIAHLYALGADKHFTALSRNKQVFEDEFDLAVTSAATNNLSIRIAKGDFSPVDDQVFKPNMSIVVQMGLDEKINNTNDISYKDLAYQWNILYVITSELIAEYYYRQRHEKEIKQALVVIYDTFDFTEEQKVRVNAYIEELMNDTNGWGTIPGGSCTHNMFGPLKLAQENKFIDFDAFELFVEREVAIPLEIDEAVEAFFIIGKKEDWQRTIPDKINIPIFKDSDNHGNEIYINQLTDYLVARFMGLSFEEAVSEATHIPSENGLLSTKDHFISRSSLAQHKGLKIHFIGEYQRELFIILDVFTQILAEGETPWKIDRYGKRLKDRETDKNIVNTKFITIYPGKDSFDIDPDGYNFNVVFSLLKKLDVAISDLGLSLDKKVVAHSDAGVGVSNRFSVRFWDWISEYRASSLSATSDQWVDNRAISFFENLPTAELADKILKAAENNDVEFF